MLAQQSVTKKKFTIFTMSDTFIILDQFNRILTRLQKLEDRAQYTGRYEDVHKNIEELKKKFPDVEKDVAVIRTRFDSLEEKIDYRFDMMDEKFTGKFNTQERAMNEKFNTVNEKISSLRTELHITLGVILAVLITVGIKLIFYS